jgi:hypothetical protein
MTLKKVLLLFLNTSKPCKKPQIPAFCQIPKNHLKKYFLSPSVLYSR